MHLDERGLLLSPSLFLGDHPCVLVDAPPTLGYAIPRATTAIAISSAGGSQHAIVLREAGLITTCRNRNTVLHTLTALGVATAPTAPASVLRPDPPG